MNGHLLASLDIGTSKVICAVAELSPEQEFCVTAVGQEELGGALRRGMVVSVKKVAAAIESAIEEAELVLPWSVEDVFLSVSGEHVRGFAGTGTVSVGSSDEQGASEITREDVAKAEEAARAVGLPAGCRVLETIRRDYAVDGFERLREPPMGLNAEQLSARIYTVISDKVATQNLEQCVRQADRFVSGVYPSALASGMAVLSEDEMEMGVVAVDVGAGTTDVAVFKDGTLAHLGVVSLGGDLITSDLQSLRVSLQEAEKLKTKWAVASDSMVDAKKSMKVPRLGGRGTFTVSHAVVSQIVIQRVEEIFEAVAGEISKSGLDSTELPGGMVVTGGCSRLPGLGEAAGEVTGLPVELGKPTGFETATELVSSPEYSTAVGLLLLGLRKVGESERWTRERFFSEVKSKIAEILKKLR